MIEIQRVETGQLRANCYIVAASDGEAVVIDPGDQFELIASTIAAANIEIRAVLCTHAHFDHVGAAAAVRERYDAPLHLHGDDSGFLRRASFARRVVQGGEPVPIPPIDVPLADGMMLSFGALTIKVAHTPGHSPGSVCLEIEDVLFTGDTVSSEGLGRTDVIGGHPAALQGSFRRLVRDFPPDTVIHPGHGMPITLGELSEKAHVGLDGFGGEGVKKKSRRNGEGRR